MSTQYKYIGFVGCYTKEGQADPFEGDGGYPHDRSKIGSGVLAIGVGEDGKLSLLNGGTPIITADEVPNPSYLCILERSDGDNRPAALNDGGLCIVSELSKGNYYTFAVKCDKTQDEIQVSAKVFGEAVGTGGGYPCHITSSKVGDKESVIICNYGEDEGVLSIFELGKGTDASVRIPFGPGSKIDMGRQEASHAHSTFVLTPQSSSSSMMDLCCADLGGDAIVQFAMNTSSTDGEVNLQCVENKRLSAPPGSGPRSLMFSPVMNNIAVVSLEMTAQIWLIQRNTDGSFEGLGDPVSIIPDGWPEETSEDMKFNSGRWASDAVFSPDGKYVYAAARIHNSISVFELVTLRKGGPPSLKLVQRIFTEGRTPRCICMSECGGFILVAHQHSHELTSFSRNETDGTLSFTNRIEVPNCACVKLIRPEQIG